MRLLDEQGLKQKGIKFSRQHRHRLVRQGKFPRPVKIGINTNAWPEPEIDRYIEACIAERDALAAAEQPLLLEPRLVDLPHPALGQDLTPSPAACHARARSGVRARSPPKGAEVDRSRPRVPSE
jgi:prophage regulatory protein